MKKRILPYLAAAALLAVPRTTAAQERFSLSMFHFNVQYVAGGLQGFPSGEDDNPTFDYDDAGVQDLIIVESFEPVLDLFLDHPGWGVTLEMQGYMIEVMQERHPQVLTKLKQLVDKGQAELVSFHYSDQMFLAYPALDLERSHELLRDVLESADLEVSGVVFCQEGQFGVGMAPLAADIGRDILVLPKNLFRYQHLGAYDDAPPLYELEGVDVVLGSRGFSTAEVEVQWSFFDDGELLATNGSDPYMGGNFKKNPAALAEYEQGLADAEAAGFRIATITEYVEWARQNAIEQQPLPPILDGTWQPPSTNSMRRWLGGSGIVDMGFACERDNKVVSGNVRARHWILVAETLVAHARNTGKIEADDYAEDLRDCWRIALLGQVTDASGINPFINEVNYGLDHAAAAESCAHAIIGEIAPELGGPYLEINTGTGEVRELDDQPSDLLEETDPYFGTADGLEINAPGRAIDVKWSRSGAQGICRMQVDVSEPQDGQRKLEVVFPLELQGFFLTPGLVENDTVFHPFSAFDLQEGRISLPVANGLVGIDEDLWLIKQTSQVHIAATFIEGDGKVRFIDDTLDPETGDSWVFWIVEGNENDAVDLAGRLNIHPVAYVETGVNPGRGCGCASSSPRPACLGLWLLTCCLAAMRLRRKKTY